MDEKQAVVVTTKHRGVFFGYRNGKCELGENDSLAITDARMCIYWPQDTHGVLGLASAGPGKGARISAAVEGETVLYGVTAVFPATEEAAKKWEAAPWS